MSAFHPFQTFRECLLSTHCDVRPRLANYWPNRSAASYPAIVMTRVAMPFVFATSGEADFMLKEVRLGTDAQIVLPFG